MAIDSKFYQVTNPLSSSEVVQFADVVAFNDVTAAITHAAMPQDASKGAVIFIGDKKYLNTIAQAEGVTIITTKDLAALCPSDAAILTAKIPRVAFAQLLDHLYHKDQRQEIAQSADISPDATIGKGVSIGAFAVIEAGVHIADNVQIGAHSVIAENCEIGSNTRIGAHVSVAKARIGHDVVIHDNSVIGKMGFGFELTEKGAVMMPHLGLVEIGDYVHIGSHVGIDRGVLGNTVIAEHVMIDNLVHVAHNVQIGAYSIILAQVGIAGSAVIGRHVILAGQAGVADHITIADKAIILSAAKVVRDITQAGTYGGYPAIAAKQHWREQAALRRLAAQKRKGN